MAPQTEYRGQVRLYMALELSSKEWRLAFSKGGDQIWQSAIAPGDEESLRERVAKARVHFGLSEPVEVVSCYEAGRDGFWVHRFLERRLGIVNLVIDAASMKVERRARRVKNDRADARRLVLDLIRHSRGEKDVWKVVRVPSEQAEDNRHLHRALDRLKEERTRHRVRIQSLLALHGCRTAVVKAALTELQAVRTWEGTPLPPGVRAEIEREGERLRVVEEQIRAIEAEQRKEMEEGAQRDRRMVALLASVRGVGMTSAWPLVMELFGWRDFKNRREVCGAVGLGGTPYSSGKTDRDQGISKAGNARVRRLMVELAWSWLRYQPDSHLSQWFKRRFAAGGKRQRRAGIVAVARRLLIELWHLVAHGVVPQGALLKKLA